MGGGDLREDAVSAASASSSVGSHPHLSIVGDSRPLERIVHAPSTAGSSKNPLASFLKKGSSKKVNFGAGAVSASQGKATSSMFGTLRSNSYTEGSQHTGSAEDQIGHKGLGGTLGRHDRRDPGPGSARSFGEDGETSPTSASTSFFSSAVTLPRRGNNGTPPSSAGPDSESLDYIAPPLPYFSSSRRSLEGKPPLLPSQQSHDSLVSRSKTLPPSQSSTPVIAVPAHPNPSAGPAKFGGIFSKMTKRANNLIRRQRSFDGPTTISATTPPPSSDPEGTSMASRWSPATIEGELHHDPEDDDKDPSIRSVTAPAAELQESRNPSFDGSSWSPSGPRSPNIRSRVRRSGRHSRVPSFASANSDESGPTSAHATTRLELYRNRKSMASLFTVDGGAGEVYEYDDDVEELVIVEEEEEEGEEDVGRATSGGSTLSSFAKPLAPFSSSHAKVLDIEDAETEPERRAARIWKAPPKKGTMMFEGFESDDLEDDDVEEDVENDASTPVDLSATRQLLLDAYSSESPLEGTFRYDKEVKESNSRSSVSSLPPLPPPKTESPEMESLEIEETTSSNLPPRSKSSLGMAPRPLKKKLSGGFFQAGTLGVEFGSKDEAISLDRSVKGEGRKFELKPGSEPESSQPSKTVTFSENNQTAPTQTKLLSLLQRSAPTPSVPPPKSTWVKGLGGLFDRSQSSSASKANDTKSKLKKKASMDLAVEVRAERLATPILVNNAEDGLPSPVKIEEDFKLFADDELMAMGINLSGSVKGETGECATSVEKSASPVSSIPPPLPPRRRSSVISESSAAKTLPPPPEESALPQIPPPSPPPPSVRSKRSVSSTSSTSTAGRRPWAIGTVHPINDAEEAKLDALCSASSVEASLKAPPASPSSVPEPVTLKEEIGNSEVSGKSKMDDLMASLMEDLDTQIEYASSKAPLKSSVAITATAAIPRSKSTVSSISSDSTAFSPSPSTTSLRQIPMHPRTSTTQSDSVTVNGEEAVAGDTPISGKRRGSVEEAAKRDSISIPLRKSVLPGAMDFEAMLARLESVYTGGMGGDVPPLPVSAAKRG
ncbi:hypothetical protein HDU67_003556 [Dinochytrium kinnereticum]|nr:hypothetical protein HDU67_003556 [Dinochytrium kinnereticum]